MRIAKDGEQLNVEASAPTLGFLYEVVAKVETLAMDGHTMFVFHGKLGLIDSETEPLNMALNVPETTWRNCKPGDTLQFDFRQVFSREIPPSQG